MKIARLWVFVFSLGCVSGKSVYATEHDMVPLWEKGAPGFEIRREEPEQTGDYWGLSRSAAT